jgi:hypothetical protein
VNVPRRACWPYSLARMEEVDPERLVLPALRSVLLLGAFVTPDRPFEPNPSLEPSSLRPGETLKLAP